MLSEESFDKVTIPFQYKFLILIKTFYKQGWPEITREGRTWGLLASQRLLGHHVLEQTMFGKDGYL